ncbi:hypothetical protein B296_00023647, partial [Ensete ventricosum]
PLARATTAHEQNRLQGRQPATGIVACRGDDKAPTRGYRLRPALSPAGAVALVAGVVAPW